MTDLQPKIRIVTAASLFDGHDAAINIMRRILQSKGAEIIHLGHNRSVHEIVEAAIEEDAHAIAITSYQGGHVEFFKYMKDLLEQNGCGHIKLFGGGGGTILPEEIRELHAYGITRIYSPDDGREMGLEGMIEDLLERSKAPWPSAGENGQSGFWLAEQHWNGKLPLGESKDIRRIARAISKAELGIKDAVHSPQPSTTVGHFKADPMVYGRLKAFAQEHRYNPTPSEQLLWEKLQSKKTGYKFRRQHIIGSSIADFACLSKGLVVEVDGLYHSLPDMQLSDEARTKQLQLLGFDVIRFQNHEIENDIESVLRKIVTKLESLPTKETEPENEASSPAPSGGRGAVLGITGVGGAGKSSVTDELVRRFLTLTEGTNKTIAVISVDPSKKKTGGALLGDRIRMNSISHPRAYMRSLATREDNAALSAHVQDAIDVCAAAGFDLIILESAGTGQSDASILDFCQASLYVMTPEYGAASQLEKINMLDYADLIAINKFDKAGALDALADVRKQYKRNHALWTAKDDELPIIGTMASKFNDEGMNLLFSRLLQVLIQKTGIDFGAASFADTAKVSQAVIPAARVRYLSEIADTNRQYDQWANEQAAIASKLYQLDGILQEPAASQNETLLQLQQQYSQQLDRQCSKLLTNWPQVVKKYSSEIFEYQVRDKVIRQAMTTTSLSGTRIKKVVLPRYKDWGDLLRWQLQENVPGEFPYTAGVFELKRQGEDPTRMFAGEGCPERTNKRFHYVSHDQPAKRLSTAFDSVTLYGEDPAHRPDIYGKIGNSGVSIATVDDAKKLYSGFDLCDPRTSVSMTINGPAPMLLAFFMNAAIDQQCEKWIGDNNRWEAVQQYAEEKYRHLPRPLYYNPLAPGRLPEGNNGLGLQLLGLSGNEVLPADGHRTSRYFERRPGTKHLHFQHRVCAETDGRCAGVLYSKQGAQLL
ncbi:MAG: methylmalonyl-CoA mutase family protein [Chitinophagaceae bacterium]|nr:methylmalonyl-CoA mutase family protein [Chitinophagaceae bacterium]